MSWSSSKGLHRRDDRPGHFSRYRKGSPDALALLRSWRPAIVTSAIAGSRQPAQLGGVVLVRRGWLACAGWTYTVQ